MKKHNDGAAIGGFTAVQAHSLGPLQTMRAKNPACLPASGNSRPQGFIILDEFGYEMLEQIP